MAHDTIIFSTIASSPITSPRCARTARTAATMPGPNESRASESWRSVSVSPVPPKMVSWCATSPGRRTLWIGGSGAPASWMRRAVSFAVPLGASRLRVVVQLDDLRARKHARRLRREAHHQHRAEREVRHEHRRHARLVAAVRQHDEILVGPAGRADHDGNPGVDRRARDVHRHGIHRAVDDHVEPVRDERVEIVVDHDAAPNAERVAETVAAAARERRGEMEIVRGFHRGAGDAPQSPERAGDPDAQCVHRATGSLSRAARI